jgi:hypothetical protein
MFSALLLRGLLAASVLSMAACGPTTKVVSDPYDASKIELKSPPATLSTQRHTGPFAAGNALNFDAQLVHVATQNPVVQTPVAAANIAAVKPNDFDWARWSFSSITKDQHSAREESPKGGSDEEHDEELQPVAAPVGALGGFAGSADFGTYLHEVMERVAAYVGAYQSKLAGVVAEERYHQRVVSISGPGRRPWIKKAPSRIAMPAPPGMPKATVGMSDPPSTALLHDSGPITPRMSPLPTMAPCASRAS